MSYYYNGTPLSSICRSINTNLSWTTTNLGITLNTNPATLSGVNEQPLKTCVYNESKTDISTFCIASYTENSLSIPSWCTQLRVVMIGGGGSGTTPATAQKVHQNANHQDVVYHYYVAGQKVDQQQSHTHQYVAAKTTPARHDHKKGGYRGGRIFPEIYRVNGIAPMGTALFTATHEGPQSIQGGDGAYVSGDRIAEWGWVDRPYQQYPDLKPVYNHVDSPGTQIAASNTQQDVVYHAMTPAQQVDQQQSHTHQNANHSDVPGAGSSGGGGAYVYISTFQLTGVTGTQISTSGTNVSMTFQKQGAGTTITANGGTNSQLTTAGSGGTVQAGGGNVSVQGSSLTGQTWLQGQAVSGQNGQSGTQATGGASGAGSSGNIFNAYGAGGSTSSTGGQGAYYRVYYLC